MHKKKYPPLGNPLGDTRLSAEALVTAPISTLPGNSTAAGRMPPLLGNTSFAPNPLEDLLGQKNHHRALWGYHNLFVLLGIHVPTLLWEPLPILPLRKWAIFNLPGMTIQTMLGETTATPLGITHAIHR
jgi:hypothetical protein